MVEAAAGRMFNIKITSIDTGDFLCRAILLSYFPHGF